MDFLWGIGQRVKVILPFLSCVALTYCWKSMYFFLIGGHHVNTDIVLLRLVQCAAFVAPVAVWLVHVVRYGPVLFIGACFIVLGITFPSLFSDTQKQEVFFAILYGTGTSIMFQAASMAASLIFRANIAWSLLMLGLSAIVMSMAQRLFEIAMVKLSDQLLLGLLVLIPIMCVLPACVSVLGSKRFETNDADTVLGIATNKDQTNSKEIDITTFLLISENDFSTIGTDKVNKNTIMWNLFINDLKWRPCTLLWWATGVHLSFVSSSSRDFSTNMKMLSLMCIFSMFTFGIKVLLTARKKSHRVSDLDSDNASGYFMLGLLGISSLVLQSYHLFTDVRCHSLLLSMGFFHQLRTPDFLKVPPNMNNFCWIVNRICIELVFTFCALIIGYYLANFVCYINVTSVTASIFDSGVSPYVISSAMILLSLRYSIKREQNRPISAESDCKSQT